MKARPVRSLIDFEYDQDAYEAMYGRDADGNKVIVGIKRRDQDEIDRRRAERAARAA